jgi:sterol 3beta-glucosyltransferase
VNILILTVGSRGDVQPYVALGRGLRTAGHTVAVATNVRFEAFVTGNGLGYAPLSDDLTALLDSPEGRAATEDMGSFLTGARTVIKLLKRTRPIQQALMRDGWDAARSLDPDLIIYHPKMIGAPHYADKLGIPAAMAVLFPQLVPTGAYPSLGFPRLKLGERYNKLTYWAVLAIAGRVGRRYIEEWRSVQRLSPHPRGSDVLHRSNGSRIPVLHAISRHVVADPSDWPQTVVSTGYWFLDGPAEWAPPPALERFLAAGEPPVYIGFGSMAGRDPQRVTHIVIEALRRAGLRGVLATGWGGLAPEEIPEEVFVLEEAPHDWLFPRTAAVVHHGGAGTTAAGLRAGRPTVVCPFFGDQPFWGWRVHELGVGSAPISRKDLTVDRLTRALRQVTKDPSIRERAEKLGTKIRDEDGVTTAVAAIEQMVPEIWAVGHLSG